MKAEIKIIGFTDKVNECDCCGKQNLKGTYCIEIDGSEFYYGSTCASNSINISNDEFKKQVKKNELEINVLELVKNATSEFSKRKVLKIALKKGFDKLDFFLKFGKIEDENDFGAFYNYANINVWLDK